ncbi:MAG: radical SAM protein [Vicinamibacterales bacterium]
MRVLVGQSYFLRFDPKLWRAHQPYAPLGSLYAASVLRREGHDVAFFDAMLAETTAEWTAALARTAPQVAVLFEDNFNYLSKMCLLRMRAAAFDMLASARAAAIDAIVAGADASDHADAYLDAGASVVIVGEGEETLRALADVYAKAEAKGRGRTSLFGAEEWAELGTVAGIAYRALGSLETTRTPRRRDITDLDALPRPAWDLVDVDRYRSIWRQHHGRFSMNAVTTRGCPYHCNWCAKPIWGQRYNVRSPEATADEIAWLASAFGAEHIWFADDIMGLQPGWLARFAEALTARGVRMPFKALTRADLVLRSGEAAALRRAGCETVWIGAESGSQRILDAMDKGIRVEHIERATAELHAVGIRVGFFLQFGYPGESRDDIERTFDLVRRCTPDDIGMSVAYPLPGTRFFERVRASLGARRNWVDSDDLAMLYRGPYSTAFYRQLHRVLHKEFRARRGVRLLREALRRRGAAAWPSLRPAAGALYHALTLPVARWQLDRRQHGEV